MLISITSFNGMVPKLDNEKLPDAASSFAVSARFRNGCLSGAKRPLQDLTILVPAIPVAAFVYPLTNKVFVWGASGSKRQRDVEATISPVVTDKHNRFYFTDHWLTATGVKRSGFYYASGKGDQLTNDPDTRGSPATYKKVGVPRPKIAPTVAVGNFTLPGVASTTYELIDEDSAGVVTSPTDISGTPTATATSQTLNFTARAPAEGNTIAVNVKFTMTNGTVLTAVVREDSTRTTFPTEIQNVVATVSSTPIDDTNWSYKLVFTTPLTDLESRAYVYTFVNSMGEEGPPSDPTLVELPPDGSASVTMLNTPEAPEAFDDDAVGYCGISYFRLYRTATGSSATDYLYVDELNANGTVTYSDTKKTEALAEPLSTQNYYAPPQDLNGVCVMANGIVCGFRDNEVWFSEPYLGYAWNPSYAKPLPYKIVSICPFEGGLFVTTTAYPFIIMGNSPDSMTDARVPALQAGVSRKSLINVGPYIAYVSHDGIVVSRGLDASLDMSQQLFDRETWRSYAGLEAFGAATARLATHDGSLLLWNAVSDQLMGGAVTELRLDETAGSLVTREEYFCATCVHPTADQLLVFQPNEAYVFEGSFEPYGFSWNSKTFITPKPVSFGVVQLRGTGVVMVGVVGDFQGATQGVWGYEMKEVDLTSGPAMLRLASGFMATRWRIDVSSAYGSPALVQAIHLATTPGELKNV